LKIANGEQSTCTMKKHRIRRGESAIKIGGKRKIKGSKW